MSVIIDLTNHVYGRLRVIRRVQSKTQTIFWYCHCECGGETVVSGPNLRGMHTKSCGCLQSELVKSRKTTHGLRSHPLYRIWHGIIQRCTKPYTNNFSRYGAIGVTVCKEWYDFKTFFDWAIANGWERGMQIDKDIIPKQIGIEPKLYSPNMCSIVTAKENSRNTSATKLTQEQANYIRVSKEKASVLIKKFGVSKTTIGNIRANRSWA